MKKAARRWTDDEKLAMIRDAESPGNSVSAIARAHGVSTAQLFDWRKRLREGGCGKRSSGAEESPAKALRTMEAIEELHATVVDQLTSAIKKRAINPYNAATALAGIVTSFCRLAEAKPAVLAQLEQARRLRRELEEKEELTVTPQESKLAERVCIELIRERLNLTAP
jgi:transposase-like protein